ncbi:MAG: HIT family protein [Patescibacteria group bacterium]
MDNKCLICNRIAMVKKGTNSYFVKELETGYVVIGDFQFYKGYTLFLCKRHVAELHELPKDFRKRFLGEMSLVAEAVYKAFQPTKLNYELLGNTDRHCHWHIFPRYKDDPDPLNPVWVMDKNIRCAESARPSKEKLKNLKLTLGRELDKICVTVKKI